MEERFTELDNMIESMPELERKFVMWQLLKKYKELINIPEHLDTIEDYRKEKVNRELLVSCNSLIDMLFWELWGK